MKIFIAHASADYEFIEYLIRIIFQEGMGYHDIFCTSVHGFGIKGGRAWEDEIKVAIDESKIVIAVVTPMALESVYFYGEIGRVLLGREQEKLLIPLYIFPVRPGMAKTIFLDSIQGYTLKNQNLQFEIRKAIEGLMIYFLKIIRKTNPSIQKSFSNQWKPQTNNESLTSLRDVLYRVYPPRNEIKDEIWQKQLNDFQNQLPQIFKTLKKPNKIWKSLSLSIVLISLISAVGVQYRGQEKLMYSYEHNLSEIMRNYIFITDDIKINPEFQGLKLIKDSKKKALIFGGTLSYWMNDPDAFQALKDHVESGKQLTLVFSTWGPMVTSESGGVAHLRESINNVIVLRDSLSKDAKTRLTIRFNYATSTLSGLIIDSIESGGKMAVTFKLADQHNSENRQTICIKYDEQPELFSQLDKMFFKIRNLGETLSPEEMLEKGKMLPIVRDTLPYFIEGAKVLNHN